MTPPSPLRVAFAGTPNFAVPALQALIDSGYPLAGVLTQPDRPRGRGRKPTPGPVRQLAEAHGLTVAQPETLRSDAGLAVLTAMRPDVLVVVAYGQLLPGPALRVPHLGCINIHASLLPRWR